MNLQNSTFYIKFQKSEFSVFFKIFEAKNVTPQGEVL